MNWVRKYPYYHILEKQKREIEEIERRRKEEERRAWRAAREKFKDVVSAEGRYRKDMKAEIYEVSIWDVIRMHGGKPLFKDLWELSKACADQRTCYRMLVHFKLAFRDADLELVREAERLGADVEMIITLLYNGKREEAAKLLRP